MIPVTSAGYYYPVASGVPACFTGDTQVETPSGVKRMDELKIGDLVLTAEGNSVSDFQEVCQKRRVMFVFQEYALTLHIMYNVADGVHSCDFVPPSTTRDSRIVHQGANR